MSFPLNGEWDLYFGPSDTNVLDFNKAKTQMKLIKATVPGDTYLELYRSGLAEDPFYGDNFLKMTKYEYFQWWYHKDFDFRPIQGKEYELVFKGIDTISTIWLNGTKIGTTEDAFIEYSFDITGVINIHNSLDVKIESPILWAGNKNYEAEELSWEGREEAIWLRRPQHSFGWDIAPRLVSSGIWRGVEIREKKRGFKELYFATTSIEKDLARLDAFFSLNIPPAQDLKIILNFTPLGKPGRSSQFDFPLEFNAGHLSVAVKDPLLWWPKGYGDPNLYEVDAKLLKNGEVIDEKIEKIGIRTVHLERSVEKGLFRFIVNGKPLRLRGANWTPLDAFHSRDAERLSAVLKLVDDLNCNILRSWGGGVYEDEEFFKFCDEHGIAVWQDFTMACARYPQTEEFKRVIASEVNGVVKKLRNHPCIFLWAGDNECDLAYRAENLNPDDNSITRQTIPSVLKTLDPYRPYIPSSPYISGNEKNMPEAHLWGPRDYYKSNFYAQDTSSFISEIGYHGCPLPESLKKFIPENSLWPPDEKLWRAHSVDHWKDPRRSHDRVNLMVNQVKEIFGEIPDNVADFALASQIGQAEALKFFVERARLSDRIWGIIWWNVIDSWPQFSDSVVDYYFQKKLAYYYLKRVQEPFIISISEPQDWSVKVIAINDSFEEIKGNYEVDDETGNKIMAGGLDVGPYSRQGLGSIQARRGEIKLFIIKWRLENSSALHKNHYVLAYPPLSLAKYKKWLDLIKPYDDSGSYEPRELSGRRAST